MQHGWADCLKSDSLASDKNGEKSKKATISGSLQVNLLPPGDQPSYIFDDKD